MIMVLNIPIFLLGLRTMGKKYVLNSLVGMVVSSVLIDFFHEILKLPSATDNPVLASIYGGVMLGIGLGIVFRGRASTGGSDIIGQILSKYTGMSLGFGIMITDFVIISASGFAFRNLEAPLYGYIVLFLSTKVIDMILEGWNYSKLVIITSTRIAEIDDFILNTLDRSGTALQVALPLPQPRGRDHPDRHPPQAAHRPARVHQGDRPRRLRHHQRHLRPSSARASSRRW